MSEQQQYIVSARKYRPSTFRSVVGQSSLTATLKNAISSDRLAQAYLFCGPRGVGKTSCARILAKTINCLNPTADGEACGECASCRSIDEGNSFNVVELDAASNNSVNDMRQLIEQVGMPPQVGRYRVFIIDEVHMLSSQAFNAFLKTLEEPPKYVIFILATTEKHKVLPTILSRCQIYDFKRITVQDMADHLAYVAEQEGITAEPSALGVIARKADGAMRDALSIFDQVAASSRGNITYTSAIQNLNVLDYDYYFRLVDAFREGDTQKALLIYNEIRKAGFDGLFFVNGLAAHVRDLMMAADASTSDLLEVASDIAERYREQAKTLPLQWYYVAMRLLGECDVNYRVATSKQLHVELTLIRLSQLMKPLEPPFDKVDFLPPLGNPLGRHSSAAPEAAKPAARPAEAAPAVAPAPVVEEAPKPQAAEPAPARPQGPATVAGRRVAARHGGGISLKNLSEDISDEPEREKRTRPVVTDEFRIAWDKFIMSNPEMHILTSAMRAVRPEAVSALQYKVTVTHPAQKQAFESEMPRLIEYLRDTLENDFLTLAVEIDEAAMAQSQVLTDKELLRKMLGENSLLADFLKQMNVRMG